MYMERVAIYIRVASADIEQVEKQNEIMQEWAAKNYVGVYRTYIDNGYSSNTTDRPALQKMLSETQNFDLVVVQSAERLARGVKVFKKITEELAANGKGLKIINLA